MLRCCDGVLAANKSLLAGGFQGETRPLRICLRPFLAGPRRGQQQTREDRRVTPHARGSLTVGGAPFHQLQLVGAVQLPEAALSDQALVDGTQATLEHREHGRPERDRLAVHRAAGGHHQIGVGDQRLGVDCALGNDEAAGLHELLALLGGAREYDRLGAPELVEHLREQVVLEAVVKGDLRRGAHDCDRLRSVESEL